MGAQTGIAWTDATFNPWIGCTKVGPGCDLCYAAASDDRYHGGKHWGAGAPRMRTSPAYWRGPIRWNARLSAGKPLKVAKPGMPEVPAPRWVFCASQADVFDNEVDPAWRNDLWALIRDTPLIRWQLVTKRVGNVAKMLPDDWTRYALSAQERGSLYRHVGIIATTVNQEEYDRDGPKLLDLKNIGVRWVGLSIEPQLGPIDLRFEIDDGKSFPFPRWNGKTHGRSLDWVICGGESRQGSARARPFYTEWARSLLGQCEQAGIPFFLKQLGSMAIVDGGCVGVSRFATSDYAGRKPDEWPADLQVQQMPRVYL